MKKNRVLLLLVVLLYIPGNLSLGEEFIYNSHGRKDPFAPPVINTRGKAGTEVLSGIRLEGIIWEQDNPLAIINSKVVTVGAKVGGALVVEIKKDEVVFEINGQQFPMKLHTRTE